VNGTYRAGPAEPPVNRARVYAKINIVLEIVGKRLDGYHELATVLQAIGLADELECRPTADLTLDAPPLPDAAPNLVLRAAEALQEATGCRAGAALTLRKGIPVASGLGGGSADAAAALVLLNRAWNLYLEPAELRRLAAHVGSHVPYFLFGGAVLATGRGGVLDPLREAAAACGTTVVASAALLRPHGRTLSSVVVEPDGTTAAPYDKQHLDGDEPTWFVTGEAGALIVVDGHRLALSICRDGSIPSHAAEAAAAGAVAYLNSAAYFPGGARRMDVTYAARALDHRFPVVVAGLTGRCGPHTFIGRSAIYGPDAEPLAQLDAEEGVALATLVSVV
jgi:predicted amidohydrolase